MGKIKIDVNPSYILRFCSLSLGDRDDDVRSVAASCLLPVAEHIVQRLPQSLEQILVVLWHCLCDMKDDLSSSVGVIMDLIGENLFPRPIIVFNLRCYLQES